VTPPGAVTTTETSALAETVVDDDALLLPDTESPVVDETVDVSVTVPGTTYDDGMVYVVVTCREPPATIAPSEQGYALVQSPVFDENVTPEGVVSESVTDDASDGPLFVTVTV
jgi:hypothetical protein